MTTQAEAFEDACVDTNTAAELALALKNGTAHYSCASDCKQWDITPDEWLEAIQNALASRTRIER